jgi:lysophospholipase L1-like esterase
LNRYLILSLSFVFTLTAQGRTVHLEAYGDSLTAGMLSRTQVTNPPKLDVISKTISDLAVWFMTKDPLHMAPYEAREKAWPAVLSRKLSELTGDVYEPQNFGKTGARSYELVGQVGELPGVIDAGLAFFFIGHNDIVRSTDWDLMYKEFTQNYAQALRRWDSLHTDSTAYIVPVGDIAAAFNVLKGYVWYERADKVRYSCEDSWETFFPYGRKFSYLLRKGQLNAVVDPLRAKMNAFLRQLVTEMKSVNSSNRYEYLDYKRGVVFRPEYFAIDCYHLSTEGQEYVANAVYEAAQGN